MKILGAQIFTVHIKVFHNSEIEFLLKNLFL